MTRHFITEHVMRDSENLCDTIILVNRRVVRLVQNLKRKDSIMTEKLEIVNNLAYSIVNGKNKGLKNGLYKEYNKKEGTTCFATYKRGLLNGDTSYYCDNGILKRKYHYINGLVDKYAEFDEHGFLELGIEALESGRKKYYYCEKGEIVRSGVKEDDLEEGLWFFNQPDGSVYVKNYLHGILNGHYIHTKFGETLEKGNYKDGKLDGIRTIYNHDLHIVIEKNYKKGKILYEKIYNSKGKLLNVTKY